jgi:predicted component of type VI protein secretion system
VVSEALGVLGLEAGVEHLFTVAPEEMDRMELTVEAVTAVVVVVASYSPEEMEASLLAAVVVVVRALVLLLIMETVEMVGTEN